MNRFRFMTKIGALTIDEQDGKITALCFGAQENEGCKTPLIEKAVLQIEEYLNGKRREFDLPLFPKGTDFEQKVWAALLTIPYGQTACYEDIAKLAGCPKGSRAVGRANNKNPIAIIIPCHRVIGKDKSLTGYGGGLDLKRRLLELEGMDPTNFLNQ